ncbi:MAG: hypothetical protein HOV80_26105 [Polyangiaceae bacterium]|nr:hypothetical protein [Polyangiaceae bacterium]
MKAKLATEARSPAANPLRSAHRSDFDQRARDRLKKARPAQPNAAPTPPAPPAGRDLCSAIRPADRVEYRFTYRNFIPLMDVVSDALMDAATRGGRLALGGAIVEEAGLSYAADLRFLQLWQLVGTHIGDLGSVVALAPGEETSLNIKKTQRTSFTRSVVDSSESMTSKESTQIDKDVMNVARSTTKANQWRVDSTATVSIGGVGSLSVSAGYSESTSSTINTSLQRISEATQKSAEQLKSLQKTEVTQSHEVTDETEARRRIANPYRDRSLMLNVFDLYKEFRVDTSLVEIRPSLVIEIPSLRLDRDFALGNADFLESKILDGALLEELRSALQTVQRPIGDLPENEASDLAQEALRLLFVEPHVIGDVASGPNWSIIESLDSMGNALDDAVSNHFGTAYTTLVFYHRFYQGLSAEDRARWAIRIAVTLSDSIGAMWSTAEAGDLVNVLDRNNPTELLRRVSGFLSMVDKLLKPLLVPPEDARLAQDARERAEFVLARVVAHLESYQDYYVQHYLEYVFRRTEGLSLVRLLFDVLRATGQLDLLELFDPANGFLEGNRYVVPARSPISLEDAMAWIKELGGDSVGTPIGETSRSTIALVPTDGVHIEPSAGRCVLMDVPPPNVNVHTELSVSTGERVDGGDA